jgi:hypothetical protein
MLVRESEEEGLAPLGYSAAGHCGSTPCRPRQQLGSETTPPQLSSRGPSAPPRVARPTSHWCGGSVVAIVVDEVRKGWNGPRSPKE